MTRLAPNYVWWDDIYDNAKHDALAKGFRIDEINFSGFYSQGDGASWQGIVDIAEWLTLNRADDVNALILLELVEDGWLSNQIGVSSRSNRYAHSNTMDISGYGWTEPDDDDVITKGMLKGAKVIDLFESIGGNYLDALFDDVLESARDYANDIYDQLQKEYEWLCSEEVIAELCDVNEYLFDEHGKVI